MVGRGSKCALTQIDCLSHLCDVVLVGHNELPSTSAHVRARNSLEAARLHVNDYLKRANVELSQDRCVEVRAEGTCVLFLKSGLWADSYRRDGVNDLFNRLFVKDHVRSVSIEVVRQFTIHLTDIVWLLLLRLSLVALGVQSLRTFFQVNVASERFSLIKLLGMVAWCEQTLTNTLTFGDLVGIPVLTRSVGLICGWENPFKALAFVQSFEDELRLAQLVSYNHIHTDTTLTQVLLVLFADSLMTFFSSQKDKRFGMRRIMYAHIALRALLSSVPRGIPITGHRLTLVVRFAIAQYVADVHKHIAKNWLHDSGRRLPSLCFANADAFRKLGLTVDSTSSNAWINRNTDFFHVLPLSEKLDFQRVLLTVRAELQMSDGDFTGETLFAGQVIFTQSFFLAILVPAFFHEALLYGKSWTELQLNGTGPFDGIETITGDAGLLTLAHEPTRKIHKNGLKTLLSRVWVGDVAKGKELGVKGKRAKDPLIVREDAFATPFLKSLVFTPDLERLTVKVPVNSKTPRQRGSVCAFMQVVLVSLFCRLRHLQTLITGNDISTFHRLLYTGCYGDKDLVAAELKFVDIVEDCTAVDAKNILAFWQAGICGLHSYNVVHDNIKGVAQKVGVHNWMVKILSNGTFNLDRDWLLNRKFQARYRSKIAILPKWDVSCFSTSGSRVPIIVTSIGHLEKLAWIVPRNDIESLDSLDMEEAPGSILTAEIKAVWNQPDVSDCAFPLPSSHSLTAVSYSIPESASLPVPLCSIFLTSNFCLASRKCFCL